jgi:hypothetical protein
MEQPFPSSVRRASAAAVGETLVSVYSKITNYFLSSCQGPIIRIVKSHDDLLSIARGDLDIYIDELDTSLWPLVGWMAILDGLGVPHSEIDWSFAGKQMVLVGSPDFFEPVKKLVFDSPSQSNKAD